MCVSEDIQTSLKSFYPEFYFDLPDDKYKLYNTSTKNVTRKLQSVAFAPKNINSCINISFFDKKCHSDRTGMEIWDEILYSYLCFLTDSHVFVSGIRTLFRDTNNYGVNVTFVLLIIDVMCFLDPAHVGCPSPQLHGDIQVLFYLCLTINLKYCGFIFAKYKFKYLEIIIVL